MNALLMCLLALIALGVCGPLLSRWVLGRRLFYLLALAVMLLVMGLSLDQLLSGAAPVTEVLAAGIPWIGMHLRVDALSAFFLVVIGLGGAAASLYGMGYGAHGHDSHRVLPFFAPFLAGMSLVVVADDAFTFLFGWEVMSVVSWALVMAHHNEEGTARAGYVYLIMASMGTMTLLMAFGLMSGGGAFAFEAIRANPAAPWAAGLAMGLALYGCGSKAGVVPVNAWLPMAHPVAPSHVSALMSGVMTKVAVYAFIRIVFDLLGPPHVWWSALVLVVGAATAMLGILYALMERELKRLLAYSTVENIGIIFTGLGLSLAFKANGMGAEAALAFTAALFHVLNHTLFKSLLFFAAGAVLARTGSRDMETLGGLIHRMPGTALAFLTGAFAISALPPLNGFVSEWLTFQAILISPNLPQLSLQFLVPAVGAVLAVSAALAAACFVRAFGISFLGRPRSAAAAQATETDRFSLAAMFALGLMCLVAGVLPGAVVDALAPVAAALAGGNVPDQLSLPWLTLVPVASGRSAYNGLMVLAFIAIGALSAAWSVHRLASSRVRRSDPWDCGFPDAGTATQYTAASFSQPIRRVFGGTVFDATEAVEMPAPGDTAPARFTLRMRDFIWELFYAPLAAVIVFLADRMNRFQFLTVRRYLSLVFGALVFLLLVLVLWR